MGCRLRWAWVGLRASNLGVELLARVQSKVEDLKSRAWDVHAGLGLGENPAEMPQRLAKA